MARRLGRRSLIAGLCALVLVLGAFAAFQGPSEPPITQPVAFNHKAHIDMGLECSTCHSHYSTQTFSGLPGMETCLSCHEEAITSSPEEAKMLRLAANGEDLYWNRVYTVPEHVYYSHRRHVVAGQLACAECHGSIAEATAPPTHPQVELSMDFCMSCHVEQGASQDCIACHK